MKRFLRGLTLTRKGLLLVAIPAIFQLLSFAALWSITRAHHREREAELQAKDAVTSAYRTLGLLVDAETATRGYALTNDPSFAEAFDRTLSSLREERARLQSHARDYSEFSNIEPLAARVVDYHARNLELLGAGRRAEAIESIKSQEGKRRMDEFRAAIGRFLAFEIAQEKERSVALTSAEQRVNGALTTASAASLALAGLMAFAFSRDIATRLRTVLDNTHRLERGETLQSRVSGADEIAALDRRFHEMAAALEKGRSDLQNANEGLESFSYSVSHDLRAPIRAIDGYTRILQEDYATALHGEGARYLDVIRSESRRMAMLIDDLLTFARLGRQSLNLVPLDLRTMAAEVIREIGSAQEVRFTAGDAPPAMGDRSTMRQVMTNLLSNAAKYAKREGPIEVEFGGERSGDDNTYWVRDNGIGFDMRYADKLFGVFHRLHADPSIEGTGVGLAIVHRVVTRHGGRVWAEGREGAGAAFYFTLPAVSEDQNA